MFGRCFVSILLIINSISDITSMPSFIPFLSIICIFNNFPPFDLMVLSAES